MMPLRFDGADQRVAALCRAFNCGTTNVAALHEVQIPVALKESLRNEPEAEASEVIGDDPAAYSRSARSIFISNSTFWRLPERHHLAVLAHEVGHAVSHRESLESRPLFRMLNDCQIADLLACRWGFFEPLLEERTSYYGHGYGEALALWPDESAFASAMARWRQRHLMGLG